MGEREADVDTPGSKASGMRLARRAEALIHIDALPAQVWEAVGDVCRQEHWSGEATGCEWIAPADHAAAGARFRGHNRRGFRRWTRENEVTAAVPGELLAWRTLPSRLFPDSTDWRMELRPDGTGTEVRESYQIRSISRGFEVFVYWFNPSHRERSADLEEDLSRLKTYLEEGRHR
jgi:Polyketide cyclase / dehydrase and lipid transport